MPKRRRRSQKPVNHHIVYAYDGIKHKQVPVEVDVYHIEHYIITLLQRRGSLVSKGFIRHLKHFIWLHEESARDLSKNSTHTIQKAKGGK